DLTGTDVTEVAVDLEGTAGSGAGDGLTDRVTVNGTTGDDVVVAHGSDAMATVDGLSAQVGIDHTEATDVLEIRTGAGDDVVDATSIAAGTIGVVLDGGDGNDVLLAHDGGATLLGGAGDDVLIG